MHSINSYNLDKQNNGNGNTTSLYNLINIMFKHKFKIFFVFFCIVSIVTIFTFFMSPVYQSSSKILVEREANSEKSLLFRMNLDLSFAKYNWIKSEVEIMQSIPVIKKVITELKLDQTKYTSNQAHNLSTIIMDCQSRLKLENSKESNVIDIQYESENPDLAANFINTLIEAYIEYRALLFNESEEYQFFEKQIRVAEDKLNELEKRQSQFKESAEIVSPELQRDILLTKISDYEKKLTDVRTKRIGREAMLNVIKEQIEKGSESNIPVTESSDSPSREKFIAILRGELLGMELKRDKLLQEYTSEYSEVVNLEKEIHNTRERIEKEINQIVNLEETAIRALKAEENALSSTISHINQQTKEFSQKEYELNQLSRGIKDNREVYSMLLKQREEARISQAKLEHGVKIKVISPAQVPFKPVRPRKKVNVMIAIILGLSSAFGFAFLVEYFDHTLNSPTEVEKYLDLPVWGSISTNKIKLHSRKKEPEIYN